MSSDNRTQVNDCDDDATTFTTSGGQLGTENSETGLIFEGSASVEVQHSNNNDETSTTTNSAGTGLNEDWTDSTVYVVVKDNLVETFEASTGGNGGMQIVLGDGTDRIGYPVGGSNARGAPLSKQFNAMKLDVSAIVASPPSNVAVYSGSEANLSQAAITRVGYGSFHSSKAAGSIPNVWIDGIYVIANGSYALTINGGTVGTPETMADVVGDDETNGWGLVANPLAEQYLFVGPTEWGESAANADHYFEASDEQWYWLGDNGGGHVLGDGNFPFRVIGNGTDTGSFVLTRVVIVNTGARAEFDLSSTDMDTQTFEGCVFTDLGVITLQVQDAGNKFFEGCVFNNCAKMVVSSMDMDNITYNGGFDADGAILLDEDSDASVGINGTQTGLTFNSDGTGHAVHVQPTGAGPFEFDFDNWLFNDYASDVGTATDRAVYIDPVTSSADITINILNGGDTPSIREAAGYTGTLTINNSVTVTITGVTEGSSIQVIADETAGTVTAGDVLGQGLADANGEFSFTLNFEAAFGAGLDVLVRARNQGFPTAAIQFTNSVFTDQTEEANSTTVDDMELIDNVTPAANDAYYFGHNEEFSQLKLDISQQGVGTWTVVWEYWNGSTWTALSGVTDGTSGFTAATGEQTVSWTVPGDWADTTVNSQGPYRYVRARVSSFTGITTAPLARKCKLDVRRYLPYEPTTPFEITSAGLNVNAGWTEDDISVF